MSSPVADTGISVFTDRKWSLGVVYQSMNRHLALSTHLDGVWKAAEQLQDRPEERSSVASITYLGGKEIRIYYFDRDYIVQELCWSDGKGWYQGAIGQMEAKATPGSGLAAVVFGAEEPAGGAAGEHIRVYYQESGSNAVKELGNDGSWYNGALNVSGAVGSTSLAAVAYYFQEETQLRVYYQAADLTLREYGYNEGSEWFQGEFNPGKAATETPLAAIAFGDVQIQVYWRDWEADDLEGPVTFARNTGSWEDATYVNFGRPIGTGYRFAVLQWDNGQYLRFYYQLLNTHLTEWCSDDGGETWFVGNFKPQSPA